MGHHLLALGALLVKGKSVAMAITEEDGATQRHEPAGGPPEFVPAEDTDTRDMTVSECWKALGDSGIAHLALRAEPVGVDIYPVNYLVSNGRVLFRTGPGTKLTELASHPYVALQFEQLVGGWWFSVLVKGKAERLAFDEDIESSGVLDLDPAQRGDKFNYVRIVPDAVIGRTFPDASHAH